MKFEGGAREKVMLCLWVDIIWTFGYVPDFCLIMSTSMGLQLGIFFLTAAIAYMRLDVFSYLKNN